MVSHTSNPEGEREVLDRINDEGIRSATVRFDELNARTKSMRIWARLEDDEVRIRSVSAYDKGSGRVICEGMSPETIADEKKVREELEETRKEREMYAPNRIPY